MKNKIQKIIAGTIIFSIVFSCVGLSSPKKAEAQMAVVDAGNIAQTTITAANSVVSSFATYSLQYKEFILDNIGYMIAKQILRQITSSVVNWINSGFQGSPSFVTNPAGFFVDVADQLTGAFISQSGALSQLCSTINLDLRIALALKYRPYSQQRYACTLSTVIKNAQTSVKNASINGFTAGDFKQGGWPAFVSLTTEPQNNYIGAYIMASDDLSYQIANRSVQQKDELNQGQGFLSWKTCKKTFASPSNTVSPVTVGPQGFGATSQGLVGVNTPLLDSYTNGPAPVANEVCETQTPGKVIAGALESQLGSPVRELELADEFNEIVNALFSQLVSTVLSGGLRAASGRSPSDKSSYTNQLQQEIDGVASTTTKTQLIKDIDQYTKNAQGYRANKVKSLAVVQATKDLYAQVIDCYARNNDATNASSTETYVAIHVQPTLDQLNGEISDLDQSVVELSSIKTLAQAATSTPALNIPSTRFGTLLQSQALISAGEITIAKEEIATIKDQMSDLKRDAQQKLFICKLSHPNN